MLRYCRKFILGYWFPALFMALGSICSLAAHAQAQRNPDQYFFNTSFGDLKQELEDAKRSGKKGILIVFEAQDCPYCLRMHNTVLNRSDVQNAFREHFAIFKLSIDSTQSVTGIDGSNTTEAALAKQLKIFGTPYSLAIGSDGRDLGRLPGAPIDAGEYLLFKDYLISGTSRSESFAQFKAQRKNRT